MYPIFALLNCCTCILLYALLYNAAAFLKVVVFVYLTRNAMVDEKEYKYSAMEKTTAHKPAQLTKAVLERVYLQLIFR